MATQNIAFTAGQFKAGLTDRIEKLKDFSENVKDRFDSACTDVQRGVATTQAAVKDAVIDVRRKVRTRPFTALAATAMTSLALGLTVGWALGRNRRS